jgi:xyloglucan-specific endo-beta-1,4-glucanase
MLFTTLALLTTALAAPTELVSRATAQCGQYQQQTSGAYTLYTNGWGWSSGTGSQCSQIDSLTGSTLAWSTTWSWSGTANQVKSYTNVAIPFTKKQISAYTSIPTTWKWSQTGTSVRGNGTYIFVLTVSPGVQKTATYFGPTYQHTFMETRLTFV